MNGSSVTATVIIIFDGQHFRGCKAGSSAGEAISMAIREAMISLKRVHSKDALNMEATSTIRVAFGEKTAGGIATRRRPGLSAHEAMACAMAGVRRVAPRRRRHLREAGLSANHPPPAS